IAFHRTHGRRATMAVVTPPARFGSTILAGDTVTSFDEKPVSGAGEINGGFFVLEPSVMELIESDDTVWESRPLERLAAAQDLRAWKHAGFWQPMDTLRERDELEKLWATGDAPWKVW
ncbi:MAG: glycosyltransferase family protein, partial [Gemmatimonadales bacterium]